MTEDSPYQIPDHDLQFDEEQVEHLRNFGVSDSQIRNLAAILQSLRSCFAEAPRMQDVRQNLDDYQNALRNALVLGVGLSEAVSGAALEAYNRVEIAAPDQGRRGKNPDADLGVIFRTLSPLQDALASAEDALAVLPSQQRRHERASPALVELINNALLIGWGNDHHTVLNGDDDSIVQTAQQPHYPFKVGTEDFAWIAKICVEAAIESELENPPVRAIAAFLKSRRRPESS